MRTLFLPRDDKRWAETLNADLVRSEPIILGLPRNDSVNWNLRYRAASPYVQEHVQSDAVGEGGATYDPDNFRTSTLVDCRSERLRDVEVAVAPGVVFYVWLIPAKKDEVTEDPVLFDGEGGRPDYMAFAPMGA